MIKVKCIYCDYKLEKPRWEHIIAAVRKEGGHAGKNICPECKAKGLKIRLGGKKNDYRRMFEKKRYRYI